ncbi:MAG: oxidoreductase [Alphaproteobacteria bacterium]|nr:oxidoreductase [Alphaproteobacteria bacterium]
MSFRALKVTQNDDGSITGDVAQINDADLPEGGEVLVDVDYSNLNYKDGLCMTGGGRLVRDYPHIPGVDMVGTVAESSDDRYTPGDKVVVTGWRYGEIWWGGYAQRTRVKADWCVPLAEGLTPRQAMSLGTAGLTATLAIMALENHGLTPDKGPGKGDVLVTGAAGGVGSIAVAMLAHRGYSVAAVTGRPETAEYLTSLGASKIVPREELAEATTRPMESALWAGCIDNVGGASLSRLIGQMDYGASVAAVGNASGIKIETTVLPFLLRGVNLLGIDSVMQPYDNRIQAWKNAAAWMPFDKLDDVVTEARLEDMMDYAQAILKGQIKGRVLVNPNT